MSGFFGPGSFGGGFFRGPANSYLGMLDSIAGVSSLAALSYRRLTGDWNGAAVNIRRQSDNLLADISFNQDGTFDSAAAIAHCGSDNGWVTKWYDQSGNGRHFEQPTQANQPQIAGGGSVLTKSGKPSMFLNGSAHYLTRPAFMFANGSVTAFMVVGGSANAYRVLLSEGSDSSGVPLYYIVRQTGDGISSSFTLRDDLNGSPDPSTPLDANLSVFGAAQPLHVISTTDDGSIMTNWVDGTYNVTDPYTRRATSVTRANIGASTPSGFPGNFFQGRVSEVIIYPALDNAKRLAVEAAIKSFYGIA